MTLLVAVQKCELQYHSGACEWMPVTNSISPLHIFTVKLHVECQPRLFLPPLTHDTLLTATHLPF